MSGGNEHQPNKRDRIDDARGCSYNMHPYCGGPVLNLWLIPSAEREFTQTPAKMAQEKSCRAWRLQRFAQKRQFH